MALFCISRYTGTEDSAANSSENANQILERLHQEAAARREAKHAAEGAIAHPQTEGLSPSSNKAKKHKPSAVSTSENGEVDQLQEDVSKCEDEDDHDNEDKVDQDTDEPFKFTILGEFRPKKPEKVEPVLPSWLANPSVVSSDIKADRVRLKSVPGLDAQSMKMLRKNGIKKFFPVQAQVIPALLHGCCEWHHLSGVTGYRPRDICCSAPTGSGKTLAYVVPVVQMLRSRVVPRVRCIVVVPVGDLAAQVYSVFANYCQDTQLRVGLLTGLRPFIQEQKALVKKGPRGYQSLVDVVVSTPGRLVDHINKTAGFDLSHLRFLVIDEADRVMEEIKQDWLSLVEKAVYSEWSHTDADSIYPYPCQRSLPRALLAGSHSQQQIPLQKLLFSATLSHDPEKLYQLKLFQPLLFTSVVKNGTLNRHSLTSKDVDQSATNCEESEVKRGGEFVGKFVTPVGLTERFVQCTKSQKPLMMLYILKCMNFKHVLCFTNSVTSTHRLYHLMKLIGDVEVREFSSGIHAVRRNRILKQFASGKIQLLICTDAMARGIDVVNIDCVVSYDVPRVFATYVHRAGRTARAGRQGVAFTLLEKQEIFHFKKLLSKSGKSNANELKLKKADLKPYVEPLTKALQRLPNVLRVQMPSRRRLR